MIDEKGLMDKVKRWKRKVDKECCVNPDYLTGYLSALSVVEGMIAEEPKIGQWISCSERLPKCNGRYMVWKSNYYGGERSEVTICYFDGQNTWHDADGVDFARILNESDVIAWMPLPEPYKGES